MYIRMRRLAAAVIAFSAGALFASCGGGEAKVSDEEFAAAAARVAETVLLTEDDFPAGWTGSPSEDDDDGDELSDEDFEGFSDDCRTLVEFLEDTEDENFPPAIIELFSDTFGDGDENEISSSVEIHRDQETLDDSWDLIEQFIDECGGEFNELFKTLIADELENDPETAGLLGDFDADFAFDAVDGLGDHAVRMHGSMSLSAFGIPIQLDFATVLVQVGRVIVSIDTTDVAGLDEDLVDELTELTIERARAANDGLPR